MKKKVAAFDFDYTISTEDSLLAFLTFNESKIAVYSKLLLLTPYFFLALIGLITRDFAKEKLFTLFFKGLDEREFQKKCEEYAKNKLPSLLKKEALDKIRWHQEKGHSVVIISASIENYLIPLGKELLIDAVLATRLQVDKKGLLTGKLKGNNCRKEEKVRRLKEIVNIDEVELFAYGDSKGDEDLLALSDHPFYRRFS